MVRKMTPRLNKAKELYYHFYSVGTAAIGISCFDKISKDQKSILKRFRNVFDLAYGKYSDVTLAETQALEAKIEASLSVSEPGDEYKQTGTAKRNK
ncbi:MAG: hypothetical protein R3A12_16975 [Ignavibacteria bacterium]